MLRVCISVVGALLKILLREVSHCYNTTANGDLNKQTNKLSNACPEGFETDNGAALSHVSLGTEGDPRSPAGKNKDTNVSQLTGISSTDFLPAWGLSSFLSRVHRLILNTDLGRVHTDTILCSNA